MKFRKFVFACVLVSLCSVIFSACSHNSTPPEESFPITAGNRVDEKVAQDTIQKPDLPVESDAEPPESIPEEEQAPTDVLVSFSGDTSLKGEDVSAEVAAIIQEIDNSFDIKDYKVAVHRSNDVMATIDYTRVIDGFETNSVYVAILYDNKLVSLYDHTKEISESAKAGIASLSKRLGISDQAMTDYTGVIDGFMTSAEFTAILNDSKLIPLDDHTEEISESAKADIAGLREQQGMPDQATTEQGTTAQVNSKELTEALRLALEETQSSPAKEAFQQRYCYYFDAENETASILVCTDYYFDGTTAKGVDSYEYDLDFKGMIS